MAPEPALAVAPGVAAIVRPHAFVVSHLAVRDRDPDLDLALGEAARSLRASGVDPAVTDAVRAMYRRLGIDPTKTRPSSEALLRRVRRGDDLPRVNTLVDIINWCSAESGLPFGLYDLARLEGPIVARLGAPGEEYPGIRKDAVHLAGRLTLADAAGPFGNPTSDSARTMITTTTSEAWVVIFLPARMESGAGPSVERTVRQRVERYAQRGYGGAGPGTTKR